MSRLFPELLLMSVVCASAAGCGGPVPTADFTADELVLIREAASSDGSDSIPAGTMRVLTVENEDDLTVLRAKSTDLSEEALCSEEYSALCSLMVATVTHPSQDGVGIAGPQVGLNRRVVAVQRFDKEPVSIGGKTDYPFEVYPNIRIVWASDSLEPGPEGCLSVPGRRGDVLRSQEIEIEYDIVVAGCETDCEDGCGTECKSGCGSGCGTGCETGLSIGAKIQTVREKIEGFTAVIFQHEIDHLEGVLYIDRL